VDVQSDPARSDAASNQCGQIYMQDAQGSYDNICSNGLSERQHSDVSGTWETLVCRTGTLSEAGNRTQLVVKSSSDCLIRWTNPRFLTDGQDLGLPSIGSGHMNNTLSAMHWAYENNIEVLWKLYPVPVMLAAANNSWCAGTWEKCPPRNLTEWGKWAATWYDAASLHGTYAGNILVNVWYKPDVQTGWLPSLAQDDPIRMQEYVKLYLAAYDGIKERFPQARIGGPNFEATYDSSGKFEYWVSNVNGKYDFISFQNAVFPGDPETDVHYKLTNYSAILAAHGRDPAGPFYISIFGDSNKWATVNWSRPHDVSTGTHPGERQKAFLMSYLYALRNYPSTVSIVTQRWSETNYYVTDTADGANQPSYAMVGVYPDYPIRWAMVSEPLQSKFNATHWAHLEGELYEIYNITRMINALFPSGTTMYMTNTTLGGIVAATTVNGSDHYLLVVNGREWDPTNALVTVMRPATLPQHNSLVDRLTGERFFFNSDTGASDPINITLNQYRLLDFDTQERNCVDECLEGSQRCDSTLDRSVCTRNQTGCLAWPSTPTNTCVLGTHCEVTTDIPPLTNCVQDACPVESCTIGATRCTTSNDGIEVCANSSSCGVWPPTPDTTCYIGATCYVSGGVATCETTPPACVDACTNMTRLCLANTTGYIYCTQAHNGCYNWPFNANVTCQSGYSCTNITNTISCTADAGPPSGGDGESPPTAKTGHYCYRCTNDTTTPYDAINTTATCGVGTMLYYSLTNGTACSVPAPPGPGMPMWAYYIGSGLVILMIIRQLTGSRGRHR